MHSGPKVLLAVGLIATVIAVGFWVARIFQTHSPIAESAPEVGTESIPANSQAVPARTDKPARLAQQSETRATTPVSVPETTVAPAGGTNLMTDWENKVDDVLGLNAEPSEVGKKLIEMLPQLPADGRIEVLQHAVNLLADADYAPMGKMLSDPKISEEEVEILMRDALNRSNAIKLPLLLQVARTTGHIKAGEAREILEVFLGEDFGDEWDKWQSKVDEFLKENSEVSATNNSSSDSP